MLTMGETFSPTAKMASIRVVLQEAVNADMKLFQLDVKTAYLNAPIDHDIYVRQPKGFENSDKNGNELVWKLKKSLYGLKQSGRMWHNCLHTFLVENGFKQLISDNCIYVNDGTSYKIILIVWVDDIVIASSSVNEAEALKMQLSTRFKMKDFGTLSNFLGIQFEVNESGIKMHQSQYAGKILDKFKMTECNPKQLPCDLGASNIDFDSQTNFLEDPRKYREIVGSLVYLMTCTRPDLCFAVTILSQHLANPKVAHFNMAKHVMRYIKGTLDHGLCFQKSPLKIVGFTDASWASTGDRRSISGYCYMLGEESCLVSWKSKKQPIVALSSCEAEYISVTYAIQEGVFLQQLIDEMGINSVSNNVILHVDNKGAIDLSKNPVHHQRTKHISIRYHFIRSKILDGSFVLLYVPSKENIADMFTKPCTKFSLQLFNVVQKI